MNTTSEQKSSTSHLEGFLRKIDQLSILQTPANELRDYDPELEETNEDLLRQEASELERKVSELLELEPNSKDIATYIIKNGLDPELFMDLIEQKYTDFKTLKGGNSRSCFEAKWGAHELVFKFDVLHDYDNDDNRGGTNIDEIEALLHLPDPELHNIVEMKGFIDLTKYNGKGYLTIEKKFDGVSLFDYVQEHGPLSAKQFEQLVPEVLKALSHSYAKEYKGRPKPQILHRDFHAGNILIKCEYNENINPIFRDESVLWVRGSEDIKEVRITDFATASKSEDLESKTEQSVTIHALSIQDPLLSYTFTRKETKYSPASQLYELGVDLYYSLTKRSIFTFNSKQKIAEVKKTGESLLNEDGTLNIDLYEKALDNALDKLPDEVKAYKDILFNLLSLKQRVDDPEINPNYDSENPFDDLIEDFKQTKQLNYDANLAKIREKAEKDKLELENITKPIYEKQPFYKRLLGNKFALATGALGLIGLLVFGRGMYAGKETKVFEHPPIAAQTEKQPEEQQEENMPIAEQPAQPEENIIPEQIREPEQENKKPQMNTQKLSLENKIQNGAYVDVNNGDWRYVKSYFDYDLQTNLNKHQHKSNGTIIDVTDLNIVKDTFIPTGVNEIKEHAYIDTKNGDWKPVKNYFDYDFNTHLYKYQHKENGSIIEVTDLNIVKRFTIPTNVTAN